MFVQIYIPLEGACQEKMVADIQSASFDLKIHDVGGKNFRYSILKLNKSIVPDQSTVLAKPKRVIVSLKKTDLGDWQDLHKKEEKVFGRKGNTFQEREFRSTSNSCCALLSACNDDTFITFFVSQIAFFWCSICNPLKSYSSYPIQI